MRVVMLVNVGKYREGKVVEIIQAANDWVRTKKGTYLQKDFVRNLNGDPVGKDVVI